MRPKKVLNIHAPDEHLQEHLSAVLHISPLVAQVLINRNIRTFEEAKQFLSVGEDAFFDPFLFRDMDSAVRRIKTACTNGEKVLIFGDYDVDGITSLTLLKSTLKKMGLDVVHYIPHRIKEGYGLGDSIVALAQEKGISLLITVDCGTSSFDEVLALQEAGIDVIITDHHEPSQEVLPPALCCINPKVKNSGYPFRELAGVGVVLKLCQALTGTGCLDDLDVAALGTIADVVPLVSENRVIARLGLARLTSTMRPGLRALMTQSRLHEKKMNAGYVSFILGPRINASGRVDTGEVSLELLMSQDSREADKLAQTVEGFNRQRQKIEKKIFEEAQALINKEVNFKDQKVIVVAGDDWHQGVLGVVASKLADRFYRPTILISRKDGSCKGSGRSIKNFHLFDALMECSGCLETFGGHAHAVGLVILHENINDFRSKINQWAHQKLMIEDLLPCMDVDMETSLGIFSLDVCRQLQQLEPFGAANPEPLFFTKNVSVKGVAQSLGRETLKMWVSDGVTTLPAIGFGMSGLKESIMASGSFDMVFTPRLDTWNENESIILQIEEIFLR